MTNNHTEPMKVDACREAFEQWILEMNDQTLLRKDGAGNYVCLATWVEWKAWQAAWNRRTAPSANGMTDEEILEITRPLCADFRWPSTAIGIARAIARHLSDKGDAQEEKGVAVTMRLTSGEDGVFAHFQIGNGYQCGVNLDHIELCKRFCDEYRALAEKKGA